MEQGGCPAVGQVPLALCMSWVMQAARAGLIPAHSYGSQRKRWYFLLSELAEDLRRDNALPLAKSVMEVLRVVEWAHALPRRG